MPSIGESGDPELPFGAGICQLASQPPSVEDLPGTGTSEIDTSPRYPYASNRKWSSVAHGEGDMSELRLSDGVKWRQVDDEAVILDERTSMYLSANGSGTLLWRALMDGTTRKELIRQLMETYGIDAETASADVESFLAGLAANGLLAD
jgi:hypothetical protein